MRGLKRFEFGVSHPLSTIAIDRPSLHSAKKRTGFGTKVVSIKKVLDDWVHELRGVQRAGSDRLLSREFARAIDVRRLDS